MDSIGEVLGQHLRALRVSRGLTMRNASTLAGITQGYLSQIENGIHVPSARTISKLARAYGTAEIELLKSAGIVKELLLDASEGDLRPQDGAINDATLEVLESMRRVSYQQLSPLSEECTLPLFDCNAQCLHNARGLPLGIKLPRHFCAFDDEAFLLEVEDEEIVPLVFPGDWVVVSPATSVFHDEVAALYDGKRFLLRKYCRLGGMIGFHASQTRYQSWTVDELADYGLSVIGRVLRVINRELSRQTIAPSTSQ